MGRGFDSEDSRSPARDSNPLQVLLAEAAAEALTERLGEPLRPSKADLVDMVFRSATILSTMAAELGVVLRIQIRGKGVILPADEEKLSRAINALVIHLLTVSQAGGWVTIGLDESPWNGRRGFTLRLTANSTILPWKSNLEVESELHTQTEFSLCRKIVEKHGGNLTVLWQDDNQLTYSVWLPA